MIRFNALGSIELSDGQGTEILSVLAQPKRLALLAYLALADPPGYHRRDELLALFWPESEPDRARTALRGALHYLRRSLGEEVLPGRGDEVAVNQELLGSDVAAFRKAVAEEGWCDAVELYRGDLLEAFHVDGTPEFERWLDAVREELRGQASRAALEAARLSRAQGDGPAAAELARRAVKLAPYDELLLREAVSVLVELGDRAGALETLEGFRDRAVEELDAEPSAQTLELMESLKGSLPAAEPALAPVMGSTAAGSVYGTRGVEPGRGSGSRPQPSGGRRSIRRGRILALGGGCLVLLAGVVAVVSAGREDPDAALGGLDPAARRLVMADFESGRGDFGLAAALGEAFRTDFEQTRQMEILDRRVLQGVLRRMRIDSLTTLSPERAREIARREGVPAVLTARVDRVGQGFSLASRVASAASGRTVAAARETASDSTELIAAVTRLSYRLRREMARAWREAPAAEPLPAATTTSLEALEHYAAGIRALSVDPTPDRAGVHFREAVRLDPEFAMAWRRLARSYVGSDAAGDSARFAFRRAFELRDRLTERERLIVEASYWWSEGEPERQITVLRALNGLYPDDLTGLINLGNIYRLRGAPEKSIELLERATAVGPVHRLALINLMFAQVDLGRLDDAIATIDRFVADFPDDPWGWQWRIKAAVARLEYARIGQSVTELERSIRLYPRLAVEGHQILALAAQARGQDSLAAHHWRESARHRGEEPDEPEILLTAFRTDLDRVGASVFGIYEGPDSSLGPVIDSLWVSLDLQNLSVNGLHQAHWRAGRAHLVWGKSTSARRHLEALRALNADNIEATGKTPPQLLEAEAQLAVREGRLAAAGRIQREYAAAFAEQWGEPCSACVAMQMGLTFEAAQMPDSAMSRYEAVLRGIPDLLFREGGPPFWDWVSLQLKQVHYYLARLYEASGDTARALEQARLFDVLMLEADPPYRPALDATRKRIRRLEGATGT